MNGFHGHATARGLALAWLLALATAAVEAAPPALAPRLATLAAAGCERVPEASSRELQEMQCRDDRAFFLCTAMQAQDGRIDCAIDPAASRVDLQADPAALVASPGFATLAAAQPCTAWVIPDMTADKRRLGALCATSLLATLRCADAHACAATGRPACDALYAAGYASTCAPVKP